MSRKHADNRLTEKDAVCNEFFLGDIVFTLLPIGIIAILQCAFGQLDLSFFMISDWAYASIIISSLALTRMLELKFIHQKDTSFSGIILAKICVIFIILSTLCLALHVLKEKGIKINDMFIIKFQWLILVINISLLFIAHFYREKWMFERKEFPKNIPVEDFHQYSLYNLKDAKNNIRATCIAFEKEYEFEKIKNDTNEIKEYGKDEINHIIEDMQHDLDLLKQRMELWNKPPYADPAISNVPDDAAK